MMVLFEVTTMLAPNGATAIEPETRMMYGSSAAAYLAREAWSVTVTTLPPGTAGGAACEGGESVGCIGQPV